MALLLNQQLAVEKGAKQRSYKTISDIDKILQKGELLKGITRTYQPREDEGETLPGEDNRVQVKTDAAINTIVEALSDYFDVVATKDWANTEARADVVVDGQTIAAQVPVTYLLFLEKQLTDLRTMIGRLPLLDPSHEWDYDPTSGVYKSETMQTTRTKKQPRNHVLSEATPEHPAQVQMYHEDVIVGDWSTTLFSGALPAETITTYTANVDALIEAVKMAREEANSMEITKQQVGESFLNFVFNAE